MPPPPGAYPPPPNGAGPRPSMPPTPIQANAHPYYHQSPQRMIHFDQYSGKMFTMHFSSTRISYDDASATKYSTTWVWRRTSTRTNGRSLMTWFFLSALILSIPFLGGGVYCCVALRWGDGGRGRMCCRVHLISHLVCFFFSLLCSLFFFFRVHLHFFV